MCSCGGPGRPPPTEPAVLTSAAEPEVVTPANDTPVAEKPVARPDASLDPDFVPPLRAVAAAGELAKAISSVVVPPKDPDALVTYRVVSEEGGRVWFFADAGDSEFSMARVLLEADAGVFALVTRHDLVVRPTSDGAADATAPGIELTAGSPVRQESAQNGWAEISYRGPGTRGQGVVPADELGRTYPVPPRRSRRVPVTSKQFVAPGTRILAAPGGATLAEVTIPHIFDRPGVRYPVTVLRKKAGHALIVLADPWEFVRLDGVNGPAARVTGWVRAAALLPEKPLPMTNHYGEGIHGNSESPPAGASWVRLAAGTRLLSRDDGTQIGIVEGPLGALMRTAGSQRIVEIRTNVGTLEVALDAGATVEIR